MLAIAFGNGGKISKLNGNARHGDSARSSERGHNGGRDERRSSGEHEEFIACSRRPA